MNKSFCIANWKMYLNNEESINFINKLISCNLSSVNANIIICPTYVVLESISKMNINNNFSIGCQNISQFNKGAYTGETSLAILENMQCKWAIIGHSERRLLFNETNHIIAEKMKTVYYSKINPILCIGETLEEKQNNETKNILENQLIKAFQYIDFSKEKDILIAYEPVWAIGTGISADIKTIDNNIKLIKKIIYNFARKDCNIYLLYGGSVNEENASEIYSLDEINGFLIGSSSISFEKFYSICKQL